MSWPVPVLISSYTLNRIKPEAKEPQFQVLNKPPSPNKKIKVSLLPMHSYSRETRREVSTTW